MSTAVTQALIEANPILDLITKGDVITPIEKVSLLNQVYFGLVKTNPEYEQYNNKEEIDLLFMELNRLFLGVHNGIN